MDWGLYLRFMHSVTQAVLRAADDYWQWYPAGNLTDRFTFVINHLNDSSGVAIDHHVHCLIGEAKLHLKMFTFATEAAILAYISAHTDSGTEYTRYYHWNLVN